MDAIVAALIGLVGMLITGGFVWLRSEIIPRLDRIEGRLDHMNDRTDERFDGMNARMEERFDGMNARMEERFDGMNARMDERFDRTNKRMDERFDDIGNLARSQGERIARVEGREEAAAGGSAGGQQFPRAQST